VLREDAAAVFGGRVVLDDVVIQPQSGAAKHENAAAAALDRHAGDRHAERVHRRAVDLEHVVVGGQTTAVDRHGAPALVGDGDAVGEDGQGARGVVVTDAAEGEAVSAGGEDVDLVGPGGGVGVGDRPAQRAAAGGVAVEQAGHVEDRRSPALLQRLQTRQELPAPPTRRTAARG